MRTRNFPRKYTDDEIWFWYWHLKKKRESNLITKDYCDLYNLDQKFFERMNWLLFNSKYSFPHKYNLLLNHYKAWKESEISAGNYCKRHGISRAQINHFSGHMKLQNILDRLIKERGEPDLNFIPITNEPMPQSPIKAPEPTDEVLPSQQPLEISFSKDIKVIISPTVTTDKIVKIIELLKGL